jgi:hypothetical protein
MRQFKSELRALPAGHFRWKDHTRASIIGAAAPHRRGLIPTRRAPGAADLYFVSLILKGDAWNVSLQNAI